MSLYKRSRGLFADAQLLTQWYEWVEQINVTGVAKNVAEHAVLKVLQLPSVELVLSDQHDTLLNEAQRSALGRALAELLGEQVELVVSTAPIASETPNERKARLQQERQSDAEAALRGIQPYKVYSANSVEKLRQCAPARHWRFALSMSNAVIKSIRKARTISERFW